MNEIQATVIRLQIVADNDLIKKYNGLSDDIKLAVKALEKQIPKKVSNRKVVYDFPASVHGDCPACGSINLSSADTNYCNVCGQKLDFSEIDVEKEIPPNTIDLTENEIKIHTANGWKNY